MPSRTNWVPLHCSLPQHPKTIRTARALKIKVPHLVGHLACLWTWALTYTQDGTCAFMPSELEAGALWSGKSGAFYDALVEHGWIDPGPPAKLHNWQDYSGKLEEKRLKDRERKSAGHPSEAPRKSSGDPTEIEGRREENKESRKEERREEHSGARATRADGNGSPESPVPKNHGGIKNSTADLSYWDEGKPPPLDPESAELLKKAILKPMSEILKTAEQRKAELRKPKEEQAE